MQPLPKVKLASPYKNCPFCGEQILSVAIKCKHCQSMLDYSETGRAQARPLQAKLKTSEKSRGIYIILGLFFGLFGVHNFYAGHMVRGGFELIVSIILTGTEVAYNYNVTNPFFLTFSILYFAYIILEVFVESTDGDGNKMRI